MIIGIDASRANRDHKSGTEWYAYYLIRELAKLDKKNEYILYTDKPLIDGMLDLGSERSTPYDREIVFDENGYQILKSPHHNFRAKVLKWPLKYFWTQGRLSLEMLIKPCDILFVPAHTLPVIHPRKSVVTIHDIGFKRQAGLYSHEKFGYKNRALRFMIFLFTMGRHRANYYDHLDWSTKHALKDARKIITISEFSKNEMLKYYPKLAKPAKIDVVYNGYATDIFQPKPESSENSVLKKYGIEKPYIFYVGRLEKKKNTANLVEAFALVKQRLPQDKHKLVLVGDASYGYDEIKYVMREFGVDNDVLTTGWVDEADMPYIFAGARAFVFPSNYEGFGIPLLQAMATRTPVVASKAGSIPEIAEDAALLFDPTSIDDMAAKMAKVMHDESLRQDLIRRGTDRVKRFSWQRCARETLEVLERL